MCAGTTFGQFATRRAIKFRVGGVSRRKWPIYIYLFILMITLFTLIVFYLHSMQHWSLYYSIPFHSLYSTIGVRGVNLFIFLVSLGTVHNLQYSRKHGGSSDVKHISQPQ